MLSLKKKLKQPQNYREFFNCKIFSCFFVKNKEIFKQRLFYNIYQNSGEQEKMIVLKTLVPMVSTCSEIKNSLHLPLYKMHSVSSCAKHSLLGTVSLGMF